MAYWLMKTEPDEFSWDDQVARGAKGEPWTGVRNFIARGNLKAMKKGEHAFFYHTGKEKQIVGVGEVVKEHYKDKVTDLEESWQGNQLKYSFATFGFKISGDLAVEPSEVRLNASLPFAAMMFKGKIESEIREQLERIVAA